MFWTPENLIAFLVPFGLGIAWPLLHHHFVGQSGDRTPLRTRLWFWAGLILTICALQVAQHYFATLTSGPVPDLPMNVGSAVLFPLTLVVLLYLCVVRRPPEFQWVCLLVLGVNLIVGTWSCLVRQGILPPPTQPGLAPLWEGRSTYKILLGGGLTVVDALAMVVVYRWACRRVTVRVLRVALPLFAGLGLDALAYAGIEAAFGQRHAGFGAELAGQVASKAVAGLAYTGLIYVYLRRSVSLLDPAQLMGTREFLLRLVPPLLWAALDLVGLHLKPKDWRGTARGDLPQHRSGLTEPLAGAKCLRAMEPDLQTDLSPPEPATDGSLQPHVPSPGVRATSVELGPEWVEEPKPVFQARVAAQRHMNRQWAHLLRTAAGRWAAVDQNGTLTLATTQDELIARLPTGHAGFVICPIPTDVSVRNIAG